MSDRQFVRIVRWHTILTPTRVPNRYVTLCGRTAWGPTADVLPAGKACGSCDKIVVRQEDQPEDDGSTQPVETVP